MITLTPLSASASSSSPSEPVCYLLELDDARILLDMGQRDYRSSSSQSSWEYEEKVRELAPTLSLVLLSHSPTNYLSLYPYARAYWGLKCPVYATQPTVEMGRVVCLTEAESWRSEVAVEAPVPEIAERNGESSTNSGAVVRTQPESGKGKTPLRGPFVPTVEEVHEAFDWIKAIRYNQPLHLGGDLSHLLLTPFPSGHTLGGSLFKLRSPTSGTVLYAVGMNHTGERHIDGMVGGAGHAGYDEGVLRPDLLIVEAGRTLTVNPKRRARESAILDLITRTLEAHHSLLLPCDSSPRLLELLVLLDQHWSYKTNPLQRSSQPWVYPLCLVSRTAQDMVSFARSLIEWTGGVVRDSEIGAEDGDGAGDGRRTKRRKGRGGFETSYGALDFKHVRFFSTPAEFAQAFPMTRAKLVLAIPPTMSHGPSRWLFTAMGSGENNVILLTSRGEDGTLARDLFDRWERDQAEGSKWGQGKIGNVEQMNEQIQVEMNSKVPLHGAELEAHLEAERIAKEREAAHQAALSRSHRMLEADDIDSDSDSDSDDIAPTSPAGDGGAMIISSRGENPKMISVTGTEDRQMQMSFDIFVKGNQAKTARGDGDMIRFRMFPFLERRGRKVDGYGEALDVGQWVRKGKEIEEEGETEEVREAKRRKEEEDEKKRIPPEPPSKFISEQVVVNVKASIQYIDMDGLHDGQAIKTIISDLQPRQLILVRSSAEATASLLAFLSSLATAPKDIHSPGTDERVTIGEHVQSYSIMLGDSISSGLAAKWSKFEGYEVAMVDGRIAFEAGSTVPTLELASLVVPAVKKEAIAIDGAQGAEETEAGGVKAIEDVVAEGDGTVSSGSEVQVKVEPTDSSPSPGDMQLKKRPAGRTLAAVPFRAPRRRRLPASLFIGDLRLTSLKARLQSLNPPIVAEFAGEGVLICGPGVQALITGTGTSPNHNEGGQGGESGLGHIVAVRKLAEGDIVLEGNTGLLYDQVRRELYGSFAQVTAA